MARVKNVSVVKEEQPQVAPSVYTPSEKEKEVVRSVFTKFRESADDRNRNFEYFDDLSLIDYIDDSVRRFVTNIDERDDIEDWQARIHDPFTRNKVLAILGKVVQVLPIASFTGRGDEDFRKGVILTNLYEYSEDIDDYEELMIHTLLDAIVKGTAIGFEGLEHKYKDIRTVKKTDDDLTYTKETTITAKLYGSIVPLEDFYPQSVGFRNVKQMDYCFWRSVMPFQKFKSDWCMYSQAGNVQEQKTFSDKSGQRPFYLDYISSDVADGHVEVIRYYNKDTDEYVILANGIWLNPLTAYDKQEISPLPWNHKELPFWDIRFDIFGSDFFYGKSLPDRLKSLQDVLNVLNNMLLDQSFLTIFPPMLTNGFDSIEDDYLRPGRRIPIDTQGLPINQAFFKMDLGTPSGWHQYILEYTRKVMEQSSLDQVSSGQAGVGGRTTAQEVRLAAEGVGAMLGLFGRFVNYGIKRKALLRGANILQFWTDKNSPMIEKVLGEGATKEANKVFNTFKIDNTTLTNGKRGTKVIEFYANKDERPTKKALRARELIAEKQNKRAYEIVAIDPDYIRTFESDVKIVPNPKQSATKDIDKAMQLEKVRIYLSFFPEGVDKQELAAQTAEKLGDDPTKIFKKDWLIPPPVEENKALDKGMGVEPEQNLSENMMRGVRGGEGDSMQMRDLQNSMMG